MSLGNFAAKNPNVKGLIVVVSVIGIRETQTSQDYAANDLNRFLRNATLKNWLEHLY